MSQGRNVAQGEMSLREKCRREKSRREKCRREKCLLGRNVVQSFRGSSKNVIIGTNEEMDFYPRSLKIVKCPK